MKNQYQRIYMDSLDCFYAIKYMTETNTDEELKNLDVMCFIN